jgi:hypothetical protein
MALSPLGNLPLSIEPYNSRTTSYFNTSTIKNYYMIAFTPGYALQASELNELQELFYLNESLTQRMYGLWQDSAFTKLPFWEGLIPLDPTYITLNSVDYNTTTNIITVNLSVSDGWYLWTDSESKLSFWINNPTSFTSSLEVDATQEEYIGLLIDKEITYCCPSEPCPEGSDSTLRDNSQGNTENWSITCGAARLSAIINSDLGPVVRDAIASNFYPILKVSINSTGSPIVSFYDGQIIDQT